MIQKALTYKATMYRLKPMLFSQLTFLSHNLVLTSCLSGIYLEFTFLVMRMRAENIEEKKKTDRRTVKSEEKEKQRIRRKSNKINIHIWF